jgi:hypothetical protein
MNRFAAAFFMPAKSGVKAPETKKPGQWPGFDFEVNTG